MSGPDNISRLRQMHAREERRARRNYIVKHVLRYGPLAGFTFGVAGVSIGFILSAAIVSNTDDYTWPVGGFCFGFVTGVGTVAYIAKITS